MQGFTNMLCQTMQGNSTFPVILTLWELAEYQMASPTLGVAGMSPAGRGRNQFLIMPFGKHYRKEWSRFGKNARQNPMTACKENQYRRGDCKSDCCVAVLNIVFIPWEREP
jgi:hypothetical protein